MELYKKYRPKGLDGVVGNEETVAALRAMLKKETLPHTVLFSGPSGTGKTTVARILRRELGCTEADFCELNASSFRGIDTVRDVMGGMRLAPVGGTCRVWLLDEVHKLTSDAQNAALKMLEDTPRHVYFFLATTDPGKLLRTVRTRCTEMPLRLLTEAQLEALAGRVAEKEGIEVSKDIIAELAGLAGGSARAALVLLDKVRNLGPAEQSEALKARSEEEREAIDLCRALIKREPWPRVAKILKNIKGEPEQIRWAVLGYARAVLLGGKGAAQAHAVIMAFEENFYDSKEAGLARACYEAISP